MIQTIAASSLLSKQLEKNIRIALSILEIQHATVCNQTNW